MIIRKYFNYIIKYINRTFNIDNTTIQDGQLMHTAMKTSIDDNRKVLTMKNLFNECFRFDKRCMAPIIIPFHYCLLYMIQSGEYILSSDFVSSNRKLHSDEAAALCSMIHFPTNTTMYMVRVLIFDNRSYGPNTTSITLS